MSNKASILSAVSIALVAGSALIYNSTQITDYSDERKALTAQLESPSALAIYAQNSKRSGKPGFTSIGSFSRDFIADTSKEAIEKSTQVKEAHIGQGASEKIFHLVFKHNTGKDIGLLEGYPSQTICVYSQWNKNESGALSNGKLDYMLPCGDNF